MFAVFSKHLNFSCTSLSSPHWVYLQIVQHSNHREGMPQVRGDTLVLRNICIAESLSLVELKGKVLIPRSMEMTMGWHLLWFHLLEMRLFSCMPI